MNSIEFYSFFQICVIWVSRWKPHLQFWNSCTHGYPIFFKASLLGLHSLSAHVKHTKVFPWRVAAAVLNTKISAIGTLQIASILEKDVTIPWGVSHLTHLLPFAKYLHQVHAVLCHISRTLFSEIMSLVLITFGPIARRMLDRSYEQKRQISQR